MSDPVPVSPPPAADQASKFEDFVDIFVSPAKVFARRAAASPALPFVIVSALLIVLYFVNRNVLASIMDAEISRQMEAAMKKNPNVNADQLAASKAMGLKFAAFGAIVFVPISLLLLGVAAWIVGRVLGGKLAYGTALLIASFAWMPRVIEAILISVQGLLLDTSRMTSHFQLQLGPARLLDPATAPMWQLSLLGRVDLITLWVTVLLAIGLVYAGKVPRSKVVLAGVLMWVIGSLPAFWQALRG
ncbi:MAG TPA: YIP1 family protein [Gemmatimonadaceae bacterium]|nr:YIP1 family protein [Gemmatimonadaceae bacterium]